MTSQVEISIPSASISATPKPYTVYNISLRLPLRSFTLQKRYSDFTALHNSLAAQTGQVLPFVLPKKSYFTNTTSSPALTEERRKGLEAYLQGINSTDDQKWRDTSAWRTFLNLPSTATSRSSTATNLHGVVTGAGVPVTDPVVWLDQHRDLKSRLHDARLYLTKRDQASTAQAQHEASAQAKKSLVQAGTMIIALDKGLKSTGTGSAWHHGKLPEGELRRRRDLLSNASREKEGLENLLSAMAAKSALDRTVAAAQEKGELTGEPPSKDHARSSRPTSGRVLGKETSRTKELDNNGVLQLQQQLMKEQDEDVTILAQAVARQKELGVQIQEELEVQGSLLNMLDEDVDRVKGKVDVARKRVNDIS
ncbi:uncharacterized protein KY384_001015 [Bacidia gigantensis]|uniref:uncharacterized protein n=1 Tax=Bacidia gigantensis TaxID=2732470 RepID=UPI001D058A83|nr:uncharacterized protein KY384_001015 [Bacidia gigantensis]KAG8534171.1 hypothetical protein KY384_001015 [Bacidia gigantensis]